MNNRVSSRICLLLAVTVITVTAGSAFGQWERIIPSPSINRFALQGNTIYSATATFPNGSIHKSTDFGRTWTKCDSGLAGLPVFSIGVKDSLLLAGTYYGGIFRSSDSGKSWKASDSIRETVVVNSFLAHGEYLFAGALVHGSHGVVLRSSDEGATWKEVCSDFGDYVYSLVSNDEIVIASDHGWIMQGSSDDGQSWFRLNDLTFVTALTVQGGTIFAANGGDIYRSTDTGFSWIKSSNGLYQGDSLGSINSIVSDGRNLFLCMAQLGIGGIVGIFRSSNNGDSWQNITDSNITRSPYFQSLAICGGYLLAGADAGSDCWLYRRKLSDFSSVHDPASPSKLILEPNYPDPLGVSTKMAFILPQHSEVRLSVTDAAGRETLLIPSQNMDTGRHEITWDASRFPSGVYVCRLATSLGVATAKIVVQH